MKTIWLTTTLIFAMSASAFAQYSGPSDVQTKRDGKYTSITAAEILNDPKDDMNVVLEGKIIRKLGDDTYTFQDQSGEIIVEIDDDDFPTGDINENTVVRIEGEVDTHRQRAPDIDVDRVSVIR